MLERTVDARDVREWFDETYRRQGLSYLRPTEAYRVLVDILEPRRGERLLDVGCGPGHLLREAAAYGLALTGADLSPVAVELGMKLRNAVGHQGASGKDDWCRLFKRCGLTVERILPDQWPLMWRERAMRRLGLSPSFTRLRRGLRPLRLAGEFIFLLRHG